MNGNGHLQIDEFIRNLQLISFLTRHYIEGRFVAEASKKPISFVHMNLLRILEEHPGKTVGDVASYMSVSYPAATKTIDKLVRFGLLRRREDSSDRRVAHLHLTTAGRRLVEQYTVLKREHLEDIVGRFGTEQASLLSDHLRDFAKCVVERIPLKTGVCMHCGAFSPADCSTTESEKSCGYLDRQGAQEA